MEGMSVRGNGSLYDCVLSDSERGEEPSEGPARLFWESAVSADTQSEGYDTGCLLVQWWEDMCLCVRWHHIPLCWTGNCLSELPASIGSLSSLRTLDVSDNNIVQLPKNVAHIRTLEVCCPSPQVYMKTWNIDLLLDEPWVCVCVTELYPWCYHHDLPTCICVHRGHREHPTLLMQRWVSALLPLLSMLTDGFNRLINTQIVIITR